MATATRPKLELGDLKVGQELTGKTTRTYKNFGVFVDVGTEKDALLEVGEMTDGRIGDQKLLQKNVEVKVRVLDVNDGKLFVTMRSGDLARPPRSPGKKPNFAVLPEISSDLWLDGEVQGMNTKSVWVDVTLPGASEPVTGMVPNQNFGRDFIRNSDQAVRGGKVRVRIDKMDQTANRLYLTMKEPSSATGRGRKGARAVTAAAKVEAAAPSQPKLELGDLKVGQELAGTVLSHYKSVGVFVDVGAKERGLLEVGEMRDGFLANITLKRGDKVNAKVLDVHDGKLYLTTRSGDLARPLRARGTRADATLLPQISPDTWFDGEVSGMNTWGIFVDVTVPGVSALVTGMLHQTTFREDFADSKEAVRGGKVRVRVKDIDRASNRVDLTMEDP